MVGITTGVITIVDSSIWNVDSDAIVLANPGVDYCELDVPEGWTYKGKGSPRIRPRYGGKGSIIKNGRVLEEVRVSNIVRSSTALNYIKNYWKKHLLSGSDDDYVIIKYDTGDYEDFYNQSDVEKESAPGVFTDLSITRAMDGGPNSEVSIVFKIVW